MILLAIETATDLVGAALLGPGSTVVERSHTGGRAHAELLAPSIAEVCALAGCTLREVDTLAVDVGPGLFTGLRVGVSTAKALGQALGIGVLGVTSLDVLAAGAVDQGVGERAAHLVAVVDARRGEVFAAAYDVGHRAPDAVDAVCVSDRPDALSPADLVVWLDELAAEGPVAVVGDGALRYLDVLGPVDGVDSSLIDRVCAPSPAVLARLAARRLAAGSATVAPGDLVPGYRRHADARINWEQRAPQSDADPVPPDRR